MSVGSTKDTGFIAGMALMALFVVILLICSSCSSDDGDTMNTVLLDKVISDFMEDHHFPGARYIDISFYINLHAVRTTISFAFYLDKESFVFKISFFGYLKYFNM